MAITDAVPVALQDMTLYNNKKKYMDRLERGIIAVGMMDSALEVKREIRVFADVQLVDVQFVRFHPNTKLRMFFSVLVFE